MAFVMKPPQGQSKGLLVLSHREQELVRTPVRAFSKVVSRVKERYCIAIHHGQSARSYESAPWVDFHFAPNRSVTFDGPVERVPFDCSHFVPGYFQARNVDKHWDVLAVCSGPGRQDTRQVLRALRVVKDRRPQTRAWVLCCASGGGTATGHDHRALYRELFSAQERQQIALTVFEGASAPFALPRRDLAWLLAATRVLFLASAYDGAARQIGEALLCGAGAVLPRDDFDGCLPTRIEEGVRLFGDEAEAATAICAWLERAVELDVARLRQGAGEIHTVPRLIDALAGVYEKLGVVWQGPLDTEDLAMKLPSHAAGLAPSDLCHADGSLLRSSPEMLSYLGELAATAGAAVSLGRMDSLRVEVDALGQRGSRKAQGLLDHARRAIHRR